MPWAVIKIGMEINLIEIHESIWNGIVTLLVLFFVIKMGITLVGGWNFRDKLKGSNFFPYRSSGKSLSSINYRFMFPSFRPSQMDVPY